MQYDDKLITLDNLGTFKGKMEGEIDKASHDLIADEYDATKTYKVGDVVLHGGFLYECDTAIAQAEEWDPTKWTQVKVTELGGNGGVMEVDDYASLPTVGEAGIIYITKDTNKQYRYDATNGYVELNPEEIIEVYDVGTPTSGTSSVPLDVVAKALRGKAILKVANVLCSYRGESSWTSNETYVFRGENIQGPVSSSVFASVNPVQVTSIHVRKTDGVIFGYNNNYHYSIAGNSFTAFNADVTPSEDGKRVVRELNLSKTQDMITPNVFDTTATYAVGDVVIYQNKLYECTVAVETAGAWTGDTNWTETNTVRLINNVKTYPVTVINIDNYNDPFPAEYAQQLREAPETLMIRRGTICCATYAYTSGNLVHYRLTRQRNSGYNLLGYNGFTVDVDSLIINNENNERQLRKIDNINLYDVSGSNISLDYKQNALTFNPTVPSGTTPTPLTGIQDGSNYYGILNSEQFHPAYDSTKTYAVGDMVSYSGKFYICTTAISTAEDWTDGHWTETNPGTQVVKLSSSSGTLSDLDFAKVSSKNCEIINSSGDMAYYFARYDGQTYDFISPKSSIGSSGGMYGLAVNYCYVLKSTKGFTCSFYVDTLVGANPGSNNGAYLSGIQIGGTKYKIPANANANLAPDYDATATYDVGDCVIYGGVLYECSTAVTVAEAWDASHWTQVKVTELSNESEMEIINYQTSTALTDSQVEKLKLGKAVVYYEFYQCFLNPYQILQDRIKFIGYCCQEYQQSSNVPYEDRYVRLMTELVLSTKKFSGISSNNPLSAIKSSAASNFFDSNVDPVADGKRLVREMNVVGKLIPTYSSSDAGKVVKINSSGTGVELDETATELEVNRLFRTEYTITATITNGSASGDESIWTKETASVTIVPSSGYVLPETITVSGATYSYDNSTGVVSLSAATGAVTVTATCTQPPVEMPDKSDIITLDGGSSRFRVLGVSGSEALLLAMDDYTSSAYNPSSVTKTFDGGKTGQKYEGSTLDNLLNTTYYNSLSSNVRNAIVDQTRIQRMYSYKNPDDPSYDYHQQYNFDATKMRGLSIEDQTTVGSRHVFALDVKDIFDYLGKDTMTSAELNEMFFEQTTAVSKTTLLSSANSDYSDYAFNVYGNGGCVSYNYHDNLNVVRPAFQVNLSKVTWTKEIPVPEKGDIITLDGGTARYRVLKTNGTVAEVMALDDVANSKFNDSSVTTTFSDGSTGQKYENSTLDNYMNSTFYNSLSANVRNAIVQKAITQSIYQFGSSEITGYDFAMTRITSGTYWYKRKGQVSVGNRYCYALDFDDVAEYLGAGSGNTISGADLNDMFFEQTTSISKYVWLDSANSVNSVGVFRVYGDAGYISSNSHSSSYVVRPAFQVDISKVSWSKE